MPYRNAHWWLLGLFPLIALAFWRSYLSQVAAAPAQMHAHGVTATLWLLLMAAQSWSIHNGRNQLHRTIGPLSLILFPLFLAGGAGIFIGMAQRYAEAASPFHLLYAPRLAWLDVVGVAGFAYFYFEAMRQRRKVHPHSRYLLATVIFLLPPIFGRLYASVPPFAPFDGDFTRMGVAFQLANATAAAIAFGLAVRSGKHGRPWALAGILTVVAALLYQTVGGTAAWQALFARCATLPIGPLALVAGLSGVIVAYAGWTLGKRPAAPDGAVPA